MAGNHFCEGSALRLTAPAIQTAEAPVPVHSRVKDQRLTYYFFTPLFLSFGMAPGCQPEVPVWVGLAWLAQGCLRASSNGLSDQGQGLQKPCTTKATEVLTTITNNKTEIILKLILITKDVPIRVASLQLGVG